MYRFDEIEVGMAADSARLVSRDLVHSFGRLVGDVNPLHMDENFGKTTQFGQNIAHGMLSASFISALLANVLPGPGCVYMKQELRFLAPVFFGDVITTHVEVTEKIAAKNRLVLHTWSVNQDGKTVIDGEALGYLP